jgi:thiol-disulfide isomerase/thioredoxin
MNRRQSLSLLLSLGAAAAGHAAPRVAPELTHANAAEWINSPPLTLASLRGAVVLLEFWTFGCVNCVRTLPWLKATHRRNRDRGLVVVGVHTPEFAHERSIDNVRAAVRRLGIEYPVMIDNDFSYWKALDNRYWPAFYLVGTEGQIAATAIGELHAGEARAARFEGEIERLIGSR